MPKRSPTKLLATAGAIVATVTAGSVTALTTGASSSTQQAIATTPAGPYHAARAFGLDTATAKSVFSLHDGDQVALIRGGDARCLLRTREGQLVGEACATSAGVTSGEGITVSDECASTGAQLMEITGLAPEAATAVRLLYTDGTSVTEPVVEGACKFEGHNPRPQAPYATAVQWVSEGQAGETALLPVRDGQFCLPTS